MAEPKIIKVTAIKNGTVIDHLPAGTGVQIIKHLKLGKDEVMLGINFTSRKKGRKDVLKVENKELTPTELDQLSVFATGATVNIIRNFGVIKKFKIELPKIFTNIITCPNPNCITNHETTETKFQSLGGRPLKVKCL
jgi:aspartate carbamoyltransferase regulatory subunit